MGASRLDGCEHEKGGVRLEKINVQLYGGKSLFGGRESPLEADEIYCDRFEKCTYYKEGKCLCCRSFLSPICQFGKTNKTTGYTSRSKKYYTFKNKYKSDECYNKLKYPEERVAIMGDTLYINYVFGNVTKYRDNYSGGLCVDGYIVDTTCVHPSVFIPLNEVTNKLLYAMFSNKPRAIMGGVISDYQKKIVPDIIQSLKRIAPELYKNFIKEYPEFDKEPNYIGKKIFVNSLKPNTSFKVKGEEWLFDGECVFKPNCYIGLNSPWWNENGDMADIKIKVNDKMTIKVEDNSIIDDNTRFA